ncbi:hypothetical protein GCM10027612_61770 [Microbispora bryophytorum subsp. camponoti]
MPYGPALTPPYRSVKAIRIRSIAITRLAYGLGKERDMRAVVYEEFGGRAEVREVADPVASPDGVVIRVEATGACRSDWHGWMGHDADITVLPHVPGHELAGVVDSAARG